MSVITINLTKNPGASWGFRLQGGKDFAQPLCIQKVAPGGVAEQAGVQTGDAIISIGQVDALTLRHKEAQDTILKQGNTFALQVNRGSTIWKPQVKALPEPEAAPGGPVATKTSLAAPGKLAPTKYNTPVKLYNEENIAEALNAQAEVIGKNKVNKDVLGINFKKFEKEIKLRTDSPTFQMLLGGDDSASEPPKPRKQLPPPQEAPQAPVFPAAPAGAKGYFNVADKMYCDAHAKQAAAQNPPAPNMVPVTVKPGAPVPAGAVAAPAAAM